MTIEERNLERLLREQAVPVSQERTRAARREFLRRIAEPARESRVKLLPAAAAALLVCGTVFWAVWSERAHRPPSVAPFSTSNPPSLPTLSKEIPASEPAIPIQGVSEGGVKVSVRVLGDPPRLAIKGASRLPSGIAFQITLRRAVDKVKHGRIEETWVETGAGKELVDGEFEWVAPHGGPGRYFIQVEAPLEGQSKELLPVLREKEADRSGSIRFGLWNDSFLKDLAPGLNQVSALTREAAALAARFESAAASPESWKASKPSLFQEARSLLSKAEKPGPLRTAYPVGMTQITYILLDLMVTAEYYTWKEGRFDGATSYYQKAGEKMKTYREEEFGFDRYRAYLTEADLIAGRELLLWILKDLRQGGARSVHAEALKEHARHPGVEPFAARIGEARPETLEDLEREVRALPARK